MAATSRIVQLAQLISSNTSFIDEHIRGSGLAEPSFALDGPVEPIQTETAELKDAKNDVIEAAIELRQLLEGPMKLLLPESNFFPLAAIYRFNIASLVPIHDAIPFAELADKCGLLEHDLRRVIRYTASHHRVFCEPKKGFVAHTAASRLLAENPVARDLMGLTFAECLPAHAHTIDAMAQQSGEANVSGYALSNDTSLNTFQYLSQHPDRAQRFARAMGSAASSPGLVALSAYFDWGQLPPGSTVVDVGGSQGHVSIHLAKTFPHLQFVVQDLPEVIQGAEAKVPECVKGRITFSSHDMFTEQPVKDADVYLLRYVLHDWSDKNSVKILGKLVPSLKKGAKVVIQDHLLPEPGTMKLLHEMQIRSMDAIMLSLFNSREREEDDWKNLFAITDKRFVSFVASRIKENPSTGVVFAEWSG
ncbi:hypothetical protein FQN53_004663 [Emmonsiellopsis sp. PD_33]|nr:hypothetical protein FQN53_004663 [Emmonsiellopsis sp. PD_33]